MRIRDHNLRSTGSSSVTKDFEEQHCVIFREGVNTQTAHDAFSFMGRAMTDRDLLRRHPFDAERRLGYIPPGIESLQGTPHTRNWNRHMFDCGPELHFGEPSVRALYFAAAEACRFTLSLLDQSSAFKLRKLPEGEHRLRTAQYLLDCTRESDILFDEHRDFSLLTAFIGNGQPGLEIRIGDDWCPVELGYGDVLIGAGTPLRQFRPELKPLYHRIVGGTHFRLSSFLFFELQEEVILPKTGERYGDMMSRILKETHAQVT